MENATQAISQVSQITFSWYDYVFFSLTLSLSAIIGVYFGFIKKQTTAKDYLLGGKEMSVLPIALSLIASSVSGLALLSFPADIYTYGATLWLGTPFITFSVLISCYIYIPVFYKLQITSTYEYFQLRFDKKTRILTSFLFALCMLLYLPIVIYVPALALSQATGFNPHFITPIVCGVCIFYTTVGGLRAVVWTDALQFIIMIGSMVAVLVMGVVGAGGFNSIWSKSLEGGRFNIDFSLDLTKRDTVWSATIATAVMFLCHIGTNQGFVQKCIALPTYRGVKQALAIFTVGMITILSISIFTGLIIYTRYSNCDPLASGKIEHIDQLVPYYIMEIGQSVPGLAGLFVAGVFSAALSTLSAVLNCLAASIYEDFLSPFISKNISQERVSTILKLLVVSIGIFCTSLAFIVEHLGGLLPLAFSLPGITTGPLLGLFTVGMLIPIVNEKGAFYGGVTSVTVMAWIILNSQWYKSHGLIKYPTLPTSTNGCIDYIINRDNISTTLNLEATQPEPMFLYKISFFYYYLIAVLVVCAVSIPVSLLTRTKDYVVNKDCITPLMHFLIPKENASPPDYTTVEKALSIVKHNDHDEEYK